MTVPLFTTTSSKQEAAIRRAIISVVPDYFAWTEEMQERYRANMPSDDRSRILQILLKALFGIKTTSHEETETALESFDDEHYLLLNSTMLQLTGIGDDLFFLNEYLAENTSLLDFETVYDYDHADYVFQESMRQQDNPSHIAKPYRGSLHYRWARLQINGVFHYANLCTLAAYMHSKLEELGFDKISQMIPHEYVDGESHGKREGQGTIFDIRLEAGGLEPQLDELNSRYYNYLSTRVESLLNDYHAAASKRVYQLDGNQESEPSKDFVFTDISALQAVRFKHFMKDCNAIQGDPAELKILLEREYQAAIGFLEHSHQDIMANFDPKVVKLRKKMKVIIADEAAKDLL
ncbi:hypothetical protein [Methylocucumis oryzae]|uniref:Uncharacterized protein n=1 Tax=Methylocucumis oryzae TaxID=1632867 RepID=A0A0F3IJH5_9GAMM|nr:hypothetical protein [Methylocucumis oryzae]KJV05699.1 hypothetical protein VZ94_16330 [Methylocucumis oryzae]